MGMNCLIIPIMIPIPASILMPVPVPDFRSDTCSVQLPVDVCCKAAITNRLLTARIS
jgi:hypothetical protein